MEARRGLQELVLPILLLFQCALAQQVSLSAMERSALLELRSSLGLRGRDWPIKKDPCRSWVVVHCRNGRVTEINISGLRRTRAGRRDPRFNVDSLANLTSLVSFNASGFSLPGPIPDWFGSRLMSLQVLDLRSSSITGSIPGSLGNLSRLRALYLSGNNIVGRIPVELGKLKQLIFLDLSRNSLTGLIPSSFSSLVNLRELDLSANFLSGNVIIGLGSLQRLNLSDNSFTGSIPSQLGDLSRLIDLDISKNILSGSLPVELGKLNHLRKLILSGNRISGPVPRGFFHGSTQLEDVNLSLNKLDGALPGEFSSSRHLRILDLSGNNFTGSLPDFRFNTEPNRVMLNISNNFFYGSLKPAFPRFSWVDLSGNYFEGKADRLYDTATNVRLDRNCLQAVPRQRSLADCSLFYEKRGANFDNFGNPEPDIQLSDESNSKRTWIYVLAGALSGLVFIVILVLVLVLIVRNRRKRIVNASEALGPQGDGKDPLTLSGLGQPYSYEQLLNATGGFSEANLIKHGHSGDLFRGILEGGTRIVVKRLGTELVESDTHGLELEVFRKASHPRLVPLLGHCLERENEKLLVYKYMQNRDLASSFYMAANTEAESLRSLDWITRLKIATGAAEVLSYLHHECIPPLVHRDVQASSILLDDNYEVRLGSMSEVRSQEDQKPLTKIIRKQQTSEAGPSALSSVCCPYDVYCFGKVLLELITGKLGISMSNDKSAKDWLDQTASCISRFDRELVSKILDPSLIVDDDLLEEVWAMAIVAKSCLNPKASRRPAMKHVLKALENPLKVVRAESFSSAQIRTASSMRSWSAGIFGSWRQSSSESAATSGQMSREGASWSKQYYSSDRIEHSGSHKRLSSEIFPEPLEIQDPEKQRVYRLQTSL